MMLYKFSQHLKEAKVKDVKVAMAAGRFTGVTSEHKKLLDKVFAQKADHHKVFVMGPKDKSEVTEKDPFTVDEKIEHLKKLYPQHAASFIPGTHQFTKTPNQAMAYAYHQHKHEGNVHLTVVAGSGEAGIKNKSSAGGSIDSYKELFHKYNGTRFPEREENGKKVGGDHRMNYASANFIENPRGETSGSVVRKFAHDHDHNNPEHVEKFKQLLHPGFDHKDAKKIMKRMKEVKGIKS